MAAVGLVVLTGCGRYFAPDRNLKEYLTDSDVVGRWRLTDKSLRLLARDKHSPPADARCEIVFRADGTCEFRGMDFNMAGGSWAFSYYDAKGTWKLEHDKDCCGSGPAKNQLSMELELPQLTSYRDLWFDREDGKLVLWEFYGDPDSWEFMEHTRVPDAD